MKIMEIKRGLQVRRCAIIIGNNMWGGDILPGVSSDVDAIISFLLSPAGGAWIPESIFKIDEPISRDNFLELLKRAVKERYEYFFIYFAGHGELSKNLIPSFVLPGGDEVNLNEIRETLSTKPVLMISDCCQGIPTYEQGGVLNESQRMFSSGNTTDCFRASRMFDIALRKLPPMFTFTSAVSPGQFAGESEFGGLYTQGLLQACKQTLQNENIKGQVVDICYLHSIASNSVFHQSKGKQLPSISECIRSYQPPFLIVL